MQDIYHALDLEAEILTIEGSGSNKTVVVKCDWVVLMARGGVSIDILKGERVSYVTNFAIMPNPSI